MINKVSQIVHVFCPIPNETKLEKFYNLLQDQEVFTDTQILADSR